MSDRPVAPIPIPRDLASKPAAEMTNDELNRLHAWWRARQAQGAIVVEHPPVAAEPTGV